MGWSSSDRMILIDFDGNKHASRSFRRMYLRRMRNNHVRQAKIKHDRKLARTHKHSFTWGI